MTWRGNDQEEMEGKGDGKKRGRTGFFTGSLGSKPIKRYVPNGIKLSVNPELLCTCDQFRLGLSCLT